MGQRIVVVIPNREELVRSLGGMVIGTCTRRDKTTTTTTTALTKTAMARKWQQQDEGESSKTLPVALDPDALDCPICVCPFEVDAPIFQCKNGHAACGKCCAAVHGECPSCREPIGDIRCRPLENAIAGVALPCAFAELGCTRRLRHAEWRAHEALFCEYAPCACPYPGCSYAGHLLHDHILVAHGGDDDDDEAPVRFVRETTVTLQRTSAFRVLLHAMDARVFLLLNGGGVPSGRSLSLVCLGARPGGDRVLEHTTVVNAGSGAGAVSLSATGAVPCTRRWAGLGHAPAEGFLFVPDAYWASSGTVSVTVHVRKMVVADKP
ncbi:hypothetical protein ACP70R_012114 [Stipagrostis hirtigluma subsp. patula]